MPTRATVCALALCLALPAAAQDEDGDAARRAAAERYLETEGVQRMMDDMSSPQAVVAQLRAQFPQMPQDTVDEIAAIAADELSTLDPALERAIVEATVANFTLEEIEAMVDFYGSETGAAIMGKMQPYMSAVWSNVGPELRQVQADIARRIDALMQNR